MDKFEQYKLNLGKKEKDLVIEYLNKIKNFIEKNKIDKELFNDIEEMVFEKLSLEKDLDQLKVIRVLKEVGEPEVIFSDYIDEKKEEKKVNIDLENETVYEKLIRNGWYRDNENAIFLGISKSIGEKLGSNIWVIRILFFLFFFAGGISAWFYILAGVILPIKGEKYEGMSNFLYFRFQTYKMIKDLISNTTRSVIKLTKFIFVNFFGIMKDLLNFIVKNIFPIFRFFIFIFLAFNFLLILLALLGGGAAYFSGFSIENIEFMSSLPTYFIRGITAGIISATIAMVACILYGINKKVLNSYILSLAGISFIVALFFGISTGFDLVKKYSMKNEFTQTGEIILNNTGTYTLNLKKIIRNDFDLNTGISGIKLVNSTGNTLKIQINNTFFGNEEISQKIMSGFANISFGENDGEIKLSLENNKTFSKKVPFTILDRNLTIYVPEEVRLNMLPSWGYYYENVSLGKKYEKYSSYARNECTGKEIWYSKEDEGFICSLSEYELQSAQTSYLRNYVIENFDEITPIKHENRYKRDYYNDFGTVSDWNFDYIEFKDEKNLDLEFSDMSLKINANLNIEDTASGVIISDFKINDAEIINEYSFDKKYYVDLSSIEKFLDK